MEYKVRLHYKVRQRLARMCGGKTPARVVKRVRILLSLDAGHSVEETAERVDGGTATVKRVRRRFLDKGWEWAICDAPRPGRPKRLKDKEEKELIALACTDPPDGAARWTVRLLAKHYEKGVSKTMVQRVLREDELKPWREKNVVRSNARRSVQRAYV